MKTQLIILFSCALFVSGALGEEIVQRPANWAVPMQMEGVPNLHKVNDVLYRSAQPSKIGMQKLQEMGIKTIVNLRSFHTDHDEMNGTSLGYEQLYMKTWHPELEDAVKFLKIVTDPARQPVLVHCQHGADRTGTMCAIYRIVVEGWTKEAAIREMTEGGYEFHEIWQNLPSWIEQLNIENLRAEEEKK